MYADKFFHKTIQTDAGRYNCVGDKYVDPDSKLPGRWKAVKGKPAFPVVSVTRHLVCERTLLAHLSSLVLTHTPH